MLCDSRIDEPRTLHSHNTTAHACALLFKSWLHPNDETAHQAHTSRRHNCHPGTTTHQKRLDNTSTTTQQSMFKEQRKTQSYAIAHADQDKKMVRSRNDIGILSLGFPLSQLFFAVRETSKGSQAFARRFPTRPPMLL